MSEVSNTPSERQPYSEAYYERICRHGKSFVVHCNECQLEGFCGCHECSEKDKA